LIGDATVDGNGNIGWGDEDSTEDVVAETSIIWSAFLESIVSTEILGSLGNH
jgi:hypothetical protein